MPRIA
jgi:hypothetical protein